MNPPEPLEVELLVPLSKRRTISVAAHEEWRDWIHGGPAQTRKESEVDRLEEIFHEIELEQKRRSA